MAALAAVAAGLVASGVGPSLTGAYGAALWNQLDASAPSSGAKSGSSSTVVTYAEEVPCDPPPVAAAADPKVARHRPIHKVRRRPILHKVGLHTSAPVVSKPTPPKPIPVVHRPVLHRAILHKVVARAHHRRLRLARVAAVVAPKRCVTLHSEHLNSADIAYGGVPVAAVVMGSSNRDWSAP